MIRTGEKLTVELFDLPEPLLSEIRRVKDVIQASFDGEKLSVNCKTGSHAMISILDLFRQNGMHFGRVYSEPPTLNDVFLEITGKQLRD